MCMLRCRHACVHTVARHACVHTVARHACVSHVHDEFCECNMERTAQHATCNTVQEYSMQRATLNVQHSWTIHGRMLSASSTLWETASECW
jgi:hypothetical protein